MLLPFINGFTERFDPQQLRLVPEQGEHDANEARTGADGVENSHLLRQAARSPCQRCSKRKPSPHSSLPAADDSPQPGLAVLPLKNLVQRITYPGFLTNLHPIFLQVCGFGVRGLWIG